MVDLDIDQLAWARVGIPFFMNALRDRGLQVLLRCAASG